MPHHAAAAADVVAVDHLMSQEGLRDTLRDFLAPSPSWHKEGHAPMVPAEVPSKARSSPGTGSGSLAAWAKSSSPAPVTSNMASVAERPSPESPNTSYSN